MGIFTDDSDSKSISIIAGAFIVITAIVCYTVVVID